MNIKPRNYDWVDFYDKVIDVTDYAFSAKAILPPVYPFTRHYIPVDELYAAISRRMGPVKILQNK